jgi:hypothetical protein
MVALADSVPTLPEVFPEVMTAAEAIRFLRLDTDGRKPYHRLQTLMRFQALPKSRRGKTLLFYKPSLVDWLLYGPKTMPKKPKKPTK